MGVRLGVLSKRSSPFACGLLGHVAVVLVIIRMKKLKRDVRVCGTIPIVLMYLRRPRKAWCSRL